MEKKPNYDEIVKKDRVPPEQQIEVLEKRSVDFQKANSFLVRTGDFVEKTLEKIVGRENLLDVLNDISDFFKTVDNNYLHSEINVFKKNVGDLAGESYKEFMNKSLDSIVDVSLSRFSEDDLKILEKDIKQTSYLLINGKDMVLVGNADDKNDLLSIFDPVYKNLSRAEVEEDIKDKKSKTSRFGIKSHLSTLIYSIKKKDGTDIKVPLGYFHLTKNEPFSKEDSYGIRRMVRLSAIAIDNYFNKKRKDEVADELRSLIRNDISTMNDIIRSINPKKVPVINALDIAIHFVPLKDYEKFEKSDSKIYGSLPSFGGDFYDIMKLDDKHIGFLIYDISGHGLYSAMLSYVAKSLFVKYIDPEVSTSDVMKNVFEDLCKIHPGNDTHYLVSFLGMLNLDSLVLSYTRVGIEYPFVYRNETKTVEKLVGGKSSILLFGNNTNYNPDFSSPSVKLSSNDFLVLLSDGFVDYFKDEDEKVKKKDRFSQMLHSIKGESFDSSQQFLDYMIEQRKNFPDVKPDDSTCVVVRINK